MIIDAEVVPYDYVCASGLKLIKSRVSLVLPNQEILESRFSMLSVSLFHAKLARTVIQPFEFTEV